MRRGFVGAVVAIVALSGATASCGATRSSVLPAGEQMASPRPHASPPRRCRAAQLRVEVVFRDSLMSQPFADVAITNTADRACALEGYPRIEAWGHRGWVTAGIRSARLAIALHHGIYERVDHGPHPVTVAAHRRAYFSIGTATAYQGGLHPIMLTRLSVVLPGTHSTKTLRTDLVATRPPGRPIPVGITAVRAARPRELGQPVRGGTARASSSGIGS